MKPHCFISVSSVLRNLLGEMDNIVSQSPGPNPIHRVHSTRSIKITTEHAHNALHFPDERMVDVWLLKADRVTRLEASPGVCEKCIICTWHNSYVIQQAGAFYYEILVGLQL